jgi:hypothetical protein
MRSGLKKLCFTGIPEHTDSGKPVIAAAFTKIQDLPSRDRIGAAGRLQLFTVGQLPRFLRVKLASPNTPAPIIKRMAG